MNGLLQEMFTRPMAALTSAFELLGRGLAGTQTVDGAVSRMVHTLNRSGGAPPAPSTSSIPAPPAAPPSPMEELTPEERRVLDTVEKYLSDGVALQQWWKKADQTGQYANRFPIERTFNRPDTSYGFFDKIPQDQGTLPVMGNVQEMFYDAPKAPAGYEKIASDWLREQLREFVLRYFMRVSDFRQPEAFVDTTGPQPPPYLARLSWAQKPEVRQQGFGFSQIFYKLRGSGAVGRFPYHEEFGIVDLREIGKKYEWIVLKVRIFDFNLKVRLFGPSGPQLVMGLDEESYLVLNSNFVVNQEDPEPGVIGRYGVGYAFIKSPGEKLLAYGPGQFDAAFEQIEFRILTSGEIRIRMVFVANLPKRISNLTLDPVKWSFQLADLVSFGLTSRLLAPVKGILERLPFRTVGFDPVYTYISLVHSIFGDETAQDLAVTREQLDKDFLLQHFMQHYQTMAGSLITWRLVANWLDQISLPKWAGEGHPK